MKFLIFSFLLIALVSCGSDYHHDKKGYYQKPQSGGNDKYKTQKEYSKKYNGGKYSENKKMKKMVKKEEKKKCVNNWMKMDAKDYFKNKESFVDYLKTKKIDEKSINKLVKKNFSESKSSKHHSLNKEKLDMGKKNHQSKYYKRYYDHKIAYTIKKGSRKSNLKKKLGKFAKFGKVSNSNKKFGFYFNESKCGKKYKEYEKNLKKYQKTHKSKSLRKAKQCFSQYLKKALVAKKSFESFKKKCEPTYEIYQKSLKDYEQYKKKSSEKMAKKNYEDFCNCSKKQIGEKKWDECKKEKEIEYGCKGLIKEGKCHY